jgi:FkbM family methyltransferase
MRLPWSIRRLTSRLLLNVPVKIRAGPLADVRWSLAAAGRHRSGEFEDDRIAVLRQLLAPGHCLWDIGGHHGYVTLVASRIVGATGRVVVFEPSRYNLMFLRRHVRWDARTNVEVHACALSSEDGTARFGGPGSSQTQSLGAGAENVTVRSIPSLLAAGVRPPDVLKIDAEGAEGDILRVGAPLLHDSTALLVSVHSHDACAESVAALRDADFLVVESRNVRERRARADWGKLDPDIVALGPAVRQLADAIRAIPAFSG